jgi:hypothetical protein
LKAEIEWIVGILRVGPEYKQHGDKYAASCTVVKDGDEVYLQGFSGKFSREMFQAIQNELKTLGIKSAKWSRRKQKKTLLKSETIKYRKRKLGRGYENGNRKNSKNRSKRNG